MNAHMQQLLNSVLALPESDREVFIDALIASMPDATPPFDETWSAIIERRSEELMSGKVTPIPWEDVERCSRERFGD